MARTDIHRPSAIVPSEYEPVLPYSLATTDEGWPVPSDGVNCELDHRVGDQNGKHAIDGQCCVIGLLHVARVKFAETGGTGKCSICGAHFIYGEVWRHVPTGEHVHIGHDCAAKYNLVASDPEWSAALASLKARRDAYVKKLMRDQRLAAAYAQCPGLEDALSIEHPISVDLASKLRSYGSLSEAQIDLAFRLRADSYCPERPKEANVPAPEGRVKVCGVLVSKKAQEGPYGIAIKGTVKVVTDRGVWLAWGTIPASLLSNGNDSGVQVGQRVEFTATLKRGRDEHFALFSRPTGGRIVTE
jgi:hypothetical protein